jgi:hypothetical protein
MRYGLRESYQNRIHNWFNEYDPKSTGILGGKIYPLVSETLSGRYYQNIHGIVDKGMIQKGGEI